MRPLPFIGHAYFWRWFALAVLICSIGIFLFLFRYDIRIYKDSKNPVVYDRLTGRITRANRATIKISDYTKHAASKRLEIPEGFVLEDENDIK